MEEKLYTQREVDDMLEKQQIRSAISELSKEKANNSDVQHLYSQIRKIEDELSDLKSHITVSTITK